MDTVAPLTLSAWLRWEYILRASRRVSDGAELLEIGTGGGAAAARLATRFRYTGVETDATSRATAQARLDAIGGDAKVLEDLSALDAGRTFDVVCAFEVLEHIEDDRGALAQWVERLRPGGLLVLSVPQHQHRFGPADTYVGHFRRYGREQLAERLADAGLRDISLASYGFPLGYVLEPVRNAVARRRMPAGSMTERTGGSGRFLQPRSSYQGAATRGLTAPFRLVQRPFAQTALGTGLVAAGWR